MSENNLNKKVIIVGGGLAGLMATIKLAEAGYTVDLFSIVPVKRSHSACAQGGMNAAVNTQGEGDSPQIHFEETIHGGDYLANQTLVKGMCEKAPGYIYMLDRMGVPFNRTAEGVLDFRRFGGTKFKRTAFSGATTGQQLLYALDEQVRRFEVEGKVRKFEGWEFLSAVLDESKVCRGIVAMNLNNMSIQSFQAEAVILATGGCGLIFGKSTNSVACTGSAAGAVFQQGVSYANGEFIQVHPTAIPGTDKNRLMSESARGEGGRVWTYKDGERWYFLEEMYPDYGNLVPRDIATRAIFKVCREMKLGVDGEDKVYLDVSHLPKDFLRERLGGILHIYEKFMGEDPTKLPMKIFPSVHYSMGGIYIDQKHMTNIPGLLSAGESDYQYHGANRLGANSLLSCFYGGEVAASTTVEYLSGKENDAASIKSKLFDDSVKREQIKNQELMNLRGKENPFQLWEELAEWMTSYVTVVRYNKDLEKTIEKVKEIKERSKDININDMADWVNQPLQFARQFKNMLELAHVITKGALLRDESRGAHYKPDFPERDDKNFLKTTVANYAPDEPEITYEDVDTSLIKPKERKY